jgi:hypothetical protein
MYATKKPDSKYLMAIGAVNGAIVGGALAYTHNPYWIPLGLAFAAFITTTYALARRWAAKR